MFGRYINGLDYLTGANTLDVASLGIDTSFLTVDEALLSDAYGKIHGELQIKNGTQVDGIRADGSFGQHDGVLYNGNYGKEFINAILNVEIQAAGTQLTANSASQNAFATLFEGNRWMIYRNAFANVLHWDFRQQSALGRFISFPVIDNQPTANIGMNLTRIKDLGQRWSSDALINFADSLCGIGSNANAGSFVGNKMFFANDYMVHRGSKYVSTLKMFYKRTMNTECVNTQNPFGFHLADGVLRTYLRGDEYEDIAASWDWDLIPGTTVD
ncbi:hypothetical protein H0H81_002521 [Sphagnurus paluster]|uniref:Uncharacterized protein n=1 Tax=Sphagnurus paluster TaxID=117069 RepID=A0A9P7KIE9_9AGAR|nr:hypothetical protein H0H81_002521 [Sphagnurus paluster]